VESQDVLVLSRTIGRMGEPENANSPVDCLSGERAYQGRYALDLQAEQDSEAQQAAADEFARSEFGRTQCAHWVWAMDGPQQRTGMYLQRVLENTSTSCTLILLDMLNI
jgi:hypothetical protein